MTHASVFTDDFRVAAKVMVVELRKTTQRKLVFRNFPAGLPQGKIRNWLLLKTERTCFREMNGPRIDIQPSLGRPSRS